GVELHVMQNTALGEFYWQRTDIDAHFKGKGGLPDYLVRRWDEHCPNDSRRILWDIAVFEAVLRPELATQVEVDHDGVKVQVWTKADLPGMQADYWKATAPPAPADPPETAASTDPIVISRGPEAHSYQAFPDACR